MEKIAIQGNLERGKEVIQILKSLGGNDVFGLSGEREDCYYFINDVKCINYCIKNNKLMSSLSTHTFYTLEEYEQIFNNMENKRIIQIDLITAKEWYKQGGDLRKIALQVFTEKELQSLPKSWEEYCKINPYLKANKEVYITSNGTVTPIFSSCSMRKGFPGVIPSKERAEQFLVLNKLLQIRDYYNQGWTPDWTEETSKYSIRVFENKLDFRTSTYAHGIFTFKTKELRDEFFDNFHEDLEFIKDFL